MTPYEQDVIMFQIWIVGWIILAVILPIFLIWAAKPHDDIVEIMIGAQVAAFFWMFIAFLYGVILSGLALFAPFCIYGKFLKRVFHK